MSRRVKPHKVRGRELEEVREKDPDGRIVYHHRTVDTLGKMLRAGTIDQAMHDAAKDFQAAFIIAQLDPLRALPILRVPGTGREPELNERQLDARRRVHQSLEALGGLSSPAGSCVWHVLGLPRIGQTRSGSCRCAPVDHWLRVAHAHAGRARCGSCRTGSSQLARGSRQPQSP
jgi:hypothetical protein